MRFTVKAKLIASFVLVILLTGGMALVARDGINRLDETASSLAGFFTDRIVFANDIRHAIDMSVRDEKDMLLETRDEKILSRDAEILKDRKEAHEATKKLFDIATDENRRNLEKLQETLNRYDAIQDRVRVFAKSNSLTHAMVKSMGEGEKEFQDVQAILRQLGERADLTNAVVPVERLRLSLLAVRISSYIQSAMKYERTAILAPDDASTEVAIKLGEERLETAKSLFPALNQMLIGPDQHFIDDISSHFSHWRNVHDVITVLTRENSNIHATDLSQGEARVVAAELQKQIDAVVDIARSVMAGASTDAKELALRLRLSLLITVALIMVVTIGAGVWLVLSISWGFTKAVTLANAVAIGDLNRTITVSSNDEFKDLAVAMTTMTTNLREIATQTRSATENLNSATAEIRASTQQQAAGVEEQLAAVQETSATLDEITQSGVQMARRAKEVATAAEIAVQASHAGLHAAEDATRAMDAIRDQAESVAENIVMLSEKTQAIGEIIITVNDIAERSHLLALNAAIEAASAGEHGRSFAVVAAEIKNLADQAKDATSQVRTILSEIQRGINSSVMLTEEAVKRVAYGKEQTDTTQRTIHDMSDNIQISVQTFQQIVAATNQHQIGLEQTMQALQNIRQASKQTTDSTRQLDGAAANLSALGQQLSRAVSLYRL
ncbi:MAG: methyl-accepting chemotaxis protein [Rhodospirillaceae bacterium]